MNKIKHFKSGEMTYISRNGEYQYAFRTEAIDRLIQEKCRRIARDQKHLKLLHLYRDGLTESDPKALSFSS